MFMKKIILAIGIIGLAIVGFAIFKGWFGMGGQAAMFESGQISILNDSADTISVEYKMGEENVDATIPAREKMLCGSNGFVRIFTAKKDGSYEVMYPVDTQLREVTLSQIVESVKKEAVEGEIFTKKGMLGDIAIMYEEVELE